MSKPVYLHILWHQHQPWYVDPGSQQCVMPWVRLHGVKDYYDIAWLSQHFDGWKQTINLVPSLLEQIQSYTDGTITDEYWMLSRKPADKLTSEEKKTILQRFFDAHAPRMIHPFPRYDELYRKRNVSIESALDHYTTQDYLDLQVWFNLAWIDPLWREQPDHSLAELIQKQCHFTEEEKQLVLDMHSHILKEIIPIHRDLYQEGKINLTCSPYYHPILPLLCCTDVAKISNPTDPVPDPPFVHPEDAAWHIHEGIQAFTTLMGCKPNGMWPSEGSVSDEACALMAKENIPFFATDEGILFRSVLAEGLTGSNRNLLYRLHQIETTEGVIDCVFRDHGLSDLIGFVYQNRDAKEAAHDFISHLKTIGAKWQEKIPPLVSVILDGENCWEFYPRDGHDFLRYLIEGILADSQIIPTTVPEYQIQYPSEPTIRSLHPGSWINANYRIWIGHQEDNAAWHFLRQARETLIQKEPDLNEEIRKEAWRMVHICEGSDWFWWYGDINSTQHDMLFDYLFRSHLIHLYELIGAPVPPTLHQPIKQVKKVLKGGGILFRQPAPHALRHGYYEWVGTHVIDVKSGGGAMHQATDMQAKVHYGRMNKFLSLFVSFTGTAPLPNQSQVRLHITKPLSKVICLTSKKRASTLSMTANGWEAIIDLEKEGIEASQEVWFYVEYEPEGQPVLTIPHGSELYLQGYTAAQASLYWFG